MAESPRLLSLGALCRNNLYGFFWAPGEQAPVLLIPREGALSRCRLSTMSRLCPQLSLIHI
eukprot:3685390-Alexandrium_andersonii.AAC.1